MKVSFSFREKPIPYTLPTSPAKRMLSPLPKNDRCGKSTISPALSDENGRPSVIGCTHPSPTVTTDFIFTRSVLYGCFS